jgi:hypothetical protein
MPRQVHRGTQHAGCLDVLAVHVLGAAVCIDENRRQRTHEDDQHRPADSGAKPQRGKRHPGNRRDKADGFEQRPDNPVHPAKPGHQQTQRDADKHRQNETHGKTLQTGKQVNLQCVASKGLTGQLDQSRNDFPRRR